VTRINSLGQHSQRLAAVTIETRVALAHARGVVTGSATTACASLGAAVALQDVITRRTLLLGAVRATVSGIALAARRAGGIPGTVVLCTCVFSSGALRTVVRTIRGREEDRGDARVRVMGKVVGELVKSLACSVSIAVIWAHGALARRATIAGLARALTRAAVA